MGGGSRAAIRLPPEGDVMTKSAEYLICQALEEKQAYPAVLQAIYEKGVQPIASGIERTPKALSQILGRLKGVPSQQAAALAHKRMLDAAAAAAYMSKMKSRPMIGAGS
jgi:hypothetical protein